MSPSGERKKHKKDKHKSRKRDRDREVPNRGSERRTSSHRKGTTSSPSQQSGRRRSYSPPVHRRWSPSPSPTARQRGNSDRVYQQGSSRGSKPSPRAVVVEHHDRSSRRDKADDDPPSRPRSKKSKRKSNSRSKSKSPPPARDRGQNGPAERDNNTTTAAKGGGSAEKVRTKVDAAIGHDGSPRPADGGKRHTTTGTTTKAVKKVSTGKKGKREDSTKLLSFGDDMGGEGSSQGTGFQGLGEATMKEFKRHKKLTPTKTQQATTPNPSPEDTPLIAARLNTFLGKKTGGVLGPSKISTAECRGQRPYQEDRHVVVSCLHSPDDAHSKFDACPPCFVAVYDGHNGDLASEIAKSKLHTFVAKAAPTTGLRGEPPELLEGLLRAAFASTEEEILKEAEADGGRQDGTTATACLLVGDLLVTSNVGDSRAVLGSIGHEDQLRCSSLSSDHKPEDASERRRVEAAGGEVVFNGCYRVQHEDVNCRLAVSRSLGDSQFKGNGGQPRGSEARPNMSGQLVSPEPSVKSVRLDSTDRVAVLASDGLWDVMTGVEAVEIALAAHARAPSSTGRAPSWADALTNGVAGGNAEADPANALIKEAVKRGTADNVTAIVVVLPWD